MVAKYYCDVCEAELTKREGYRLMKKKDFLVVEVIVGMNGTWNAGHCCHKCIIDAVVSGNDVPPRGSPPVHAVETVDS